MYYTSYFAKIRNLNNKENYKFATITSSKPTFCNSLFLDWSFLGPSKELLKDYKAGNISKEQYTKIYLENLNNIWLDIENFITDNKDKNIVLLCYEGPGKFCHRHLLREFLINKNIACEELK